MNHNPNDSRDVWARLTAAARMPQDNRDTAAPYGFATRVTALAFAQERRIASLFERFALRALGAASLLALCSIAFNYEVLSPTASAAVATVAVNDEADALPADDAVAVVLDFTD